MLCCFRFVSVQDLRFAQTQTVIARTVCFCLKFFAESQGVFIIITFTVHALSYSRLALHTASHIAGKLKQSEFCRFFQREAELPNFKWLDRNRSAESSFYCIFMLILLVIVSNHDAFKASLGYHDGSYSFWVYLFRA